MFGKKILTAAIIVLLFLGAGCSTTRIYRTDTDEFPRLQAILVPSDPGQHLEAIEAYTDGNRFLIQFEIEDRNIYSEGTVPPDLRKPAGEPEGDLPPELPILPLENYQEEPWEDQPENLVPLAILPKSDWVQIRDRIIDSVIPRDGKHGVIVDYLDEGEYFLFFDKRGQPKYIRIEDKPRDLATLRTYDIHDMIERGFPIFEDHLAELGIDDREVVLDTGDYGLFSYPFIYVDRNDRRVLFLRLIPTEEAQLIFTHSDLQAMTHLIKSHLGVILRPISSLGRLFTVLAATGIETVRWTWRYGFEGEPVPPVAEKEPMDLITWEKRLDEITGKPPSKGTIRFLVDGAEFFPRLIDSVQAADHSIDIRTYIFDNDDYATKFADILKKRSDDISVRVLFDGLGAILATRKEPASRSPSHIPPNSVRAYLEMDSKVKVRLGFNPWLTFDHTKASVIDHRLAFVGGMNVGREYRYEWHDLMMEVEGPVVDILADDFNKTWARAGFWGDFGVFFYSLKPKKTQAGDIGYPVRALFTKSGESEIFISQLEAIRNAQNYIYIENAYFSDDAILYELAKARRRGVDVRVIIPLKGNWGTMNRSNVLAVNAMLANGIMVFLYPGMSHLKAAVYDGWACLGSANFDRASFRYNQEINLATSHPPTVQDLISRVFEADFEKSVELTEPFPERWSDRLLEILADQL